MLYPEISIIILHKDGDAQGARYFREKPGFENTIFEIVNGGNGAKTTYDGKTKAIITPKNQ